MRQALPCIQLTGIKEREEGGSEQEIQADRAAATKGNKDHPAAQYKQEVQQKMRQEPPSDPSIDSQKKEMSSEWEARADLLASGPDNCHFVVEMDNDGRAHLRFGDDEFGEQPEAGMRFRARYRWYRPGR